VERYIDTPVKRYSSGMMVRLGFSVAAHLEPEILIVDEVLAVGDAEFQKKCIGSLQNRAKDGRTVLFVSHNLSSLKDVCTSGLYLENGAVKMFGTIEECISQYRFGDNKDVAISNLFEVPRSNKLGEAIRISTFELLKNVKSEILHGEKIKIKIGLQRLDFNIDFKDCSLLIGIDSLDGNRVFTVTSKEENCTFSFANGLDLINLEVEINSPMLNTGEYSLIFSLRQGYKGLDQVRWDGRLIVKDEVSCKAPELGGLWGYVRGEASWKVSEGNQGVNNGFV
jgi:lipopolysaccharide transport system ATP-binding protein